MSDEDLRDAAKANNTEFIVALVAAGVPVNGQVSTRTPLHWAAREGCLAACQCLLELQADIHAKDSQDDTPLTLACWKGHTTVAEYLLEHNADLTATDNEGRTSLHLAVLDGYLDTCELLVSAGSVVNEPNKVGRTPLHIGTASRASERVSERVSVLTCWRAAAGLRGRTEIAEFLLEQKADVHRQNSNGNTPLNLAAWQGFSDCVRLLVAQNATADARDNEGRTAVVCMRATTRTVTLARCCSDAVLQQHLSALEGHADVIRLLVEQAHADINARHLTGRTPLHIASLVGRLEACQALVELKGEVQVRDHSQDSPLTLACHNGHRPVVEFLLEQKADMSDRDSDHHTGLHMAGTRDTHQLRSRKRAPRIRIH